MGNISQYLNDIPPAPPARFRATAADLYAKMAEACRNEGGKVPQALPSPGKWVRVDLDNDPRGKGDMSIMIFPDQQGGFVNNWKSGSMTTFFVDDDRPLTPAEDAARAESIRKAREDAEAERKVTQDRAAEVAERLYSGSSDDYRGHPYAEHKKVDLGTRVRRGPWPQWGWKDALIIPLYAANGKLRSLEAISPDREKNFLKGGETRGCFHPLGDYKSAPIVMIGEGLATVAAAVAATGYAAVAAMNAGNLEPVASEIRSINPNAQLIFLADNDLNADGTNPGLTTARAAAAAVGGVVAVPEMGNKCDFWDLFDEQGEEAVKDTIERALAESRGDNGPTSTKSSIADWRTDLSFVGPPPNREYLVDKTFPVGKAVLVASAGGVGKSFLLLDLAHKVADREKRSPINAHWSFGGRVALSGAAVLITAEDDAIEVHSRLDALGPRSDRLYVVPLPDAGGAKALFALDAKTKAPHVTSAWVDLINQLAAVPDLKLVVLDPLQPLCALDLNVPECAQFVCSQIATLASQLKATVVVSHHFRKVAEINSPEEAREAIRGTGGLVDGVRSVYALWQPPANVAEDVCKTLNEKFERSKVVYGAVVKSNGPANIGITTFIRGESGILVDRQAEILSAKMSKPSLDEFLPTLLASICAAADDGKPYTKTGQSSPESRREELPEEIRKLSRDKLRDCIQILLDRGDLVQAAVTTKHGTSPVKWLDKPTGDFGRGVGKFAPGHIGRSTGGRKATMPWLEAK